MDWRSEQRDYYRAREMRAFALRWVAYNSVPLVCVIGASFVAASGNDGWGWLLVVAVFTHVSPG